MKGKYVVIDNYGQEIEPSVLTDAMLAAVLEAAGASFYGRYQDAHQPVEPVEPAMPTERQYGQYTISGFDSLSAGPHSDYMHFRLPDKEQVPCANVGRYGCEHWLNHGWMRGNLVLCDTCLIAETKCCC